MVVVVAVGVLVGEGGYSWYRGVSHRRWPLRERSTLGLDDGKQDGRRGRTDVGDGQWHGQSQGHGGYVDLGSLGELVVGGRLS